ncbi:MAG: hypothetical protein SGJ27_05315 [Candidatus Melainabacteria bacterium]|nr:hypothetical protein [Candidatus Melainabacteria bacterium]
MFGARPPEDVRHNKDYDEDRKPVLQMLGLYFQQRFSWLWSNATTKAKDEIELRTLPLDKRVLLAKSPQITPKEIEHLLNDASPMVRLELVHNATMNGEILKLLKTDSDGSVADAARRRQMELLGIL